MAVSVSTLSLGERALAFGRGVVAVRDDMIALPPPDPPSVHPYGPIVGIRCAPEVSAVAYPLPVGLISCDPSGRQIAVVVTRAGDCHVVDLRVRAPMSVSLELGPGVDVGRRALGLPTPAEPTPPVALLDAIWLDRVLAAVLDADLGTSPPWMALCVLHPLADQALEPWCLRDRRLALRVDWEGFRHRATRPDAPWPGLDPSVAAWLDTGSFARWSLADMPDPGTVLTDLGDLLDPATMTCVDEALGPPAW